MLYRTQKLLKYFEKHNIVFEICTNKNIFEILCHMSISFHFLIMYSEKNKIYSLKSQN